MWRCPRRPLHPVLQEKRQISLAEIIAYYEENLHVTLDSRRNRYLLARLVDRWGPELTLFTIDQAACETPESLGAPEWPLILQRFVGQGKMARGRLATELRELEKLEG